MIMSLQNGVQKDEILRRHLTRESIMGAVCYISAAILEPGVIAHDGSLARIVFGEFGASEKLRSRRAIEIENAFTAAGIDNDISSDIDVEIWKKFVFLSALSSVTSVVRLPIGVLRANVRTREVLFEAMREAIAVAHACGIAVPEDYAFRQLEFIDTLPAQMTSSMLHDLERGSRLELPWLGENLVKLAAGKAVSAPLNSTLVALLSPYARGVPVAESRNAQSINDSSAG